MKMFINRACSFYVPDFLTQAVPGRLPLGKKLVFIQVQTQPSEQMFNDIYPKYEFFFQFLGFQNNRLIRARCVNDAKYYEKREDIIKLTEQTARQIMADNK